MTPEGGELMNCLHILSSYGYSSNIGNHSIDLLANFLNIMLIEMSKPIYVHNQPNKITYRQNANSAVSLISELLREKDFAKNLDVSIFTNSVKKISNFK